MPLSLRAIPPYQLLTPQPMPLFWFCSPLDHCPDACICWQDWLITLQHSLASHTHSCATWVPYSQWWSWPINPWADQHVALSGPTPSGSCCTPSLHLQSLTQTPPVHVACPPTVPPYHPLLYQSRLPLPCCLLEVAYQAVIRASSLISA